VGEIENRGIKGALRLEKDHLWLFCEWGCAAERRFKSGIIEKKKP